MSLDPDRHRRVCDLFLEACEREGDELEEFLRGLESEDPALRAEVEVLLESDRKDHHVVDRDGGFRHLLDAMETELPERIGPFRIVRVLGEGGMGVVYEAEQDYPRRRVALKVIRPGLLTDAMLQSFQHEVQVLARLQHPGIAQIHAADFVPVGGTRLPYFALELVEGRDLLQHARTLAPAIAPRVELLIRVCEAVHHAHLHGVVHRDLKPANVLVTAEGQPKILDFGIAKATASDELTLSLPSHAQKLAGTLPYMSPEQAAGMFDSLDTRSDVYSLGVVAYEVLAGELPLALSQTNIPVALSKIQRDEPIPLGRRDGRLAGDLDSIVSTCMRKEREYRYASAGELADDLRRYLAGEPVRARPPTTWYRSHKFVKRHRSAVSFLVALFLVLCASLWISLDLLGDARGARALAEDKLRSFLRMADPRLLDGLVLEAEDLWPRRSDRLADFDSWLERADQLLSRRDLHRATSHELELEAAASAPEEAARRVQAKEVVDDFLQRLDAFEGGESPGRDQDSLLSTPPRVPVDRQEMQARREVAAHIDDWCLERYAADWDRARLEVLAEARYGGLRLEPQAGLVPLGADSFTGLQEFWAVETGARPLRDPRTGDYRIEVGTGIVFVLVPPGTFWMGNDEIVDESPRHEVEVSAFLLGKHELTQGQWFRMTGERPSYFQSTNQPNHQSQLWIATNERHPVESVSWDEIKRWLPRYEMRLPTESEWEYAGRAGSEDTWFAGKDSEDLCLFANLADRCCREQLESAGEYAFEDWSDGFVLHAPVGLLLPNDFGLYDILGNVSEWCEGSYSPDGYEGKPDDRLAVARGGSWLDTAEQSRSSYRAPMLRGTKGDTIGVRPARSLR